LAEHISYGNVLRAVGRLLDTEGALRVKLEEDPTYLTVSWLKDNGRWEHYAYRTDAGLEALLQLARSERGDGTAPGAQSWEERLRTLGQELDAEGIRLIEATVGRGLEVSGKLGDRTVRHVYSIDELEKRSMDRRAERRPSRPSRDPWWKRLLAK